MLSWMKEIALDVKIPLDERLNGNFFSEIAFDCLCPNAVTTSDSNGFTRFTKFSTDSNIVSGRFEFKITDPTTGTVYEITEGRFDALFTE